MFRKLNLKSFALLTLCLGMLLSGCTKESLQQETITPQDEPSKPKTVEVDITQPPSVIEVNGLKTLHFGNIEHFNYTLSTIARMDRFELTRWEQEIGFTSMRNEFDRIEDIYDEIETKAELDQFKKTYRDKVTFLEEGYLEILSGMYHVGSLLNPEGVVKVDGMLQQFAQERVVSIVDGNYDKLAVAKTLQQTDEDQGIYISEVTTMAGRPNGPDYLDCKSDWDNENHRVRTDIEADAWYAPKINYSYQWVQTYDPDTQTYEYSYQYVGVPDGTYYVNCNMELRIRAQKKGFLGIVTGFKTDIEGLHGANIHRSYNGSITNFWMPVNESATNVKKLLKTYPVQGTINVPNTTSVTFCFGPTHVAGEIAGGTDCHIFY